MGGERRDDGVPGGLPSQDRKMNCGDDRMEGRGWGTGVSLSGQDTGCNRDLDDKGVHEEASGNNFGVCSREADLRTLYKHREDGWIQ